MGEYMVYIWLGATAIFALIEGATASLNFVWFAIGALCAMACALLGWPIFVQILVFVVVSIVTLILTKPFLKKFILKSKVATNADRVLEREGIVLEEINNLENTGLVKVDGQIWTARTQDAKQIIPKGTVVAPQKIEGVKLIVAQLDDNTKNSSEGK